MATLRQIIEGILKSRIANPGREFFNAAVESGPWTATVRGATTAGTYEIATQNCRYTRIGRRVWLDVYIRMAGALTGGGTGYLQITGVPYAKAANTLPQGAVYTAGLDFTTSGASLSLSFHTTAADTVLYLNESSDNLAAGTVPISGLSALDDIFASICYETDDP